MPALHVAAAQINSRVGELDANFRRLERQVQSAAVVGVEVMLFAETCLHAYDLGAENVARAEALGGPLTTRLADLARRHSMTIMAGFLERDGDKVYNSQAIASPTQELRAQRKHSLTPGELRGGLTPGPRERLVVELNGIRTAIIICADGGMAGLDDQLRDNGVQYCFCPTAGGDMINGKKMRYLSESELADPEAAAWYAANRPMVFNTKAILDPADCKVCGFTSANAMGYDGRDVTHQGHCMIVDNRRVMRAQIPGTIIREHHQDQMIHAVLSF